MERIDSLGEPFQYPVPEKKKTGKKDKTRVRLFSRMVEEAQTEDAGEQDLTEGSGRRTVEQLLDAVFTSGDRLKRLPTLELIKDYRQKVKAFLKYAIQHSITVEETTSGANVLRRKRFTVLRVIDEKLEALAASVLSAQREQLSVLAQIDEINGLLVNLIS